MVGVTNPTVEGPLGGVAAPGTVSDLLDVRSPTHWYRCWEDGSLGAGIQEIANAGTDGNVDGLGQDTGTPVFSAEQPMLAGEPSQRALGFGGAARVLSTSITNLITLGVGTSLIFFKLTVAPPNSTFQTLIGMGSSVSSGNRVQMDVQRDGAGVDSLDMEFAGLTGGLSLNVGYVVPGGITINAWHLWAVIQPADTTGMQFFYDGTLIANSGLTTTGAGSVDSWWGSSFANALNRIALGARATPSIAQFLTGRIFHSFHTRDIMTNDQLTAVWDQALANGLS